ncbi:MAG TPA: hypothetical protein VK436_01835 [Methanocella sp.]|nr:hypothetical protein [Methanocella sp.]
MSDTVVEFLQASFHEQLPITIYFGGYHLRGVVAAINEDAVEIRQEKIRSVIRVGKIDAVSRD